MAQSIAARVDAGIPSWMEFPFYWWRGQQNKSSLDAARGKHADCTEVLILSLAKRNCGPMETVGDGVPYPYRQWAFGSSRRSRAFEMIWGMIRELIWAKIVRSTLRTIH